MASTFNALARNVLRCVPAAQEVTPRDWLGFGAICAHNSAINHDAPYAFRGAMNYGLAMYSVKKPHAGVPASWFRWF